MRVQIFFFGGGKELFSGRVKSQAWLSHTALPVFIPRTRIWLQTTTHPLTLFLFPSFRHLAHPCFPPPSSFYWISFTTFHPLALTVFDFPYLHFHSPAELGFFPQPSGTTQECGIDPGPPGFHSDTLCPDVISIDSVQPDQAVLAQRLFTVCLKLKPLAVRLVCAPCRCVSHVSIHLTASILHSDRNGA